MENFVIRTANGHEILVDADDYERLSLHPWCLSRGYAVRAVKLPNGKRGHLQMHRDILGLKHGDVLKVDHINRNPLDNRKVNLRYCTQHENSFNHARACGASGVKGVSMTAEGKWNARIGFNYRKVHIGNFDTIEQAAEARRIASEKLHGEFACHD